jgi:hypothetical protein
MPSQLTITEVRFNNITKSLTTAANTLELLTASFNTPFLNPISVAIRTLLDFHEVHFPQMLLDSESYLGSQNIKQNKEGCTRLMEETHQLLDAIIAVHIKLDTGGDLSPEMLKHIGNFTE